MQQVHIHRSCLRRIAWYRDWHVLVFIYSFQANSAIRTWMDHKHRLQIPNYFFCGASALGLRPPHCRGFLIINRDTTLSRTSLQEGSARGRHLYLTKTQHSPETDIHAAGGSRTLNPSQWAAEDLRLRPRGHRNRADSHLLFIGNPLPQSLDVIRQHQLVGRVHIEGLAFIELIDKWLTIMES